MKKNLIEMPNQNQSLAIFEKFKIRRFYNETEELWYFSVIDVIFALTESADPKEYFKKLRKRDPELRRYVGTNCPPVEMPSITGKTRKILMGTVEHLLRIIQSIPSKNAEPIKNWLAKVGYERMQEMVNPEIALNRSREYWQKLGRSEKWIQQRMMGQEIRNKLTDYWKNNQVTGQDEFAILTNIIHEEWSDLSITEHKRLKNLKTENLRDHMSDAELVFSALAELSTRQIAETMHSTGLKENKIPAKKGGRIAKNARRELERKTGKKVVTGKNFLPPGIAAQRKSPRKKLL
jgi:DNA-damage-inducible protein D